jgi:hypothetical protein
MDRHTSEHADKPTSEPSRQLCSPLVELRQYTLHPGQRDVLIELFERVLLDPQEATGATLIGQFRDVGSGSYENDQASLQGHCAGYCQRRAPLWMSKAYKTPVEAPI